MAIIVKHNETGKHLAVVGTGYGAFQSSSRDGYHLRADSGEMTMLACAFPDGKILWCDSKDVSVIEIDGKSPSEILEKF